MRFLFFLNAIFLLTTVCHAQQVYQIRADSVRIYNVCDTAELIIENRTQGVRGFLFNKGAGRTEFRRVRLEKIGDSRIAITGQDTLDLSTLPGIGGVDTLFRNGDHISYIKKGKQYNVYAPLLNVSEDAVPNTVAARNVNGNLFAAFYNTSAYTETLTPTKIFGSNDNYIRALDAASVHRFIGSPDGGETLRSVTDRGDGTLVKDIHFIGLTKPDSSNGLFWAYNSDTWKIYVESLGDAPDGNMILEAGDNEDEGWIFRHYKWDIPGKTDILSLSANRFLYNGYPVWHAGNFKASTKGADVVLKTEPNGHLGLENWIRINRGTGFCTQRESYLYNYTPQSWALKPEVGERAVWLEMQNAFGTNLGGFYADEYSNIGVVNANANGWRLRTHTNGNAYVTGKVEATSFYQTSLRSLKKDIQPLPYAALPILKQAQVRSFKFKADSTGKTNIGFIADEVPEQMSIPGRGGVDQASTVGLLVKSVQELSEQNEILKQQVKKLETLMQQLIEAKK